MTDPMMTLTLSLIALLVTGILSVTGLKGFMAWISLKRAELEVRAGQNEGAPSPMSRIELADLKERLRKLEAIAAGVEF